MSEAYRRQDGDLLRTYRCFSEPKFELAQQAERLLPRLLPALDLLFSSHPMAVSLHFVEEENVAFDLISGKQLVDESILMSAGKMSIALSARLDHIALLCDEAASHVNRLPKEQSELYYRAMMETDSTKALLLYCQSMEKCVEETYKKLNGNPEKRGDALMNLRTEVRPGVIRALSDKLPYPDNVSGKFAWCMIWRWTNLRVEDVESFFSLVSLRNRVAHGYEHDVSERSVEQARKMALMLLRLSVATRRRSR